MATFNGLHLRIAYSDLEPFVIILDNVTLVLSGIMPDIVYNVARSMNISLTYIREPEDKYGTLENGTYSGMLGMLHRNEVDIIMNPILPDETLLDFAYLTNPITAEAYTMLSGKKSQDAGFFLYFSVLDATVWYAIVIAAVATTIASAFMFNNLRMKEKKWRRNSPGSSCTELCIEYFWVFLSYMLQQSPSEKYLLRNSKTKSSYLIQLMVVLWVIGVAFLVMNTFRSLLVSKLTLRKTAPYIDKLEDLLDTDETKGIAPVEIYIEDALENSGIDLYDMVWLKIKHNLWPGEEVFKDETIEDVQNGKFCIFHGHLILENRLSEFYSQNSYCNLHLSKNYFFPFPLVMALQKKLPLSFREDFNFRVTRSVDADIPGKYLKSALEISKLCTSYADNSLEPLGLKNIYGVLILWFAGIICAALVLFCERIYKHSCRDCCLPMDFGL
ncbi:hypothetical protein JTE90_020449 [Oedothorax gibbosus]|uniref:Ionotropic glutamate receptor C-terminal domain-containing protein n=1 Tax=Oedothorax gibbosus TaxID=931172 RepID=A0AAV6UD14_9ARAC|nr:hypothetical protein JTE90_020449 [Oedothorax gibbosus]